MSVSCLGITRRLRVFYLFVTRGSGYRVGVVVEECYRPKRAWLMINLICPLCDILAHARAEQMCAQKTWKTRDAAGFTLRSLLAIFFLAPLPVPCPPLS